MALPVFFYGTLRDGDVRALVLGGDAARRLDLRRARAQGWTAVLGAGRPIPSCGARIMAVRRGWWR